jgi:hypothetical protein
LEVVVLAQHREAQTVQQVLILYLAQLLQAAVVVAHPIP